MKIGNGTHILVCDAGKALILFNQGDADIPDLRVLDVLTQDNPPARDQASDRPGRYPTPAGGRTATHAADPHDAKEDAFIETVATRVQEVAEGSNSGEFVIVADPRSLGRLRPHFRNTAGLTVLAEISADLAHASLSEIEEALLRSTP